MKEEIKAVVFDVGGVLFLVKDKKRRESTNLLSSFKEACLLIKGIKLDVDKSYDSLREIYLKSSAAKISKKETLKLFSKELGISPKKTKTIFKSVYSENTIENKILYNYLLRLKEQGYKIGISSIQSHLSKDVLIPKKYYSNFNALQVSCNDGLRKPDKRAFKLILYKLKVKPSESIFVDDKQENLDAAKKIGMKTIIFQNNKQFFLELNKLLTKK